MDRNRRTSPDGDSQPTGSSDPYLGDLARQRRHLDTGEACPASDRDSIWDGHDRRGDGVGCYDPYVVDVTRPGRSSF